jgi:hypothetical protein
LVLFIYYNFRLASLIVNPGRQNHGFLLFKQIDLLVILFLCKDVRRRRLLADHSEKIEIPVAGHYIFRIGILGC